MGNNPRTFVVGAVILVVMGFAALVGTSPPETTQDRVEARTMMEAKSAYGFHATSVTCTFDGYLWDCKVWGHKGEIAIARANNRGATFAPVGYNFSAYGGQP